MVTVLERGFGACSCGFYTRFFGFFGMRGATLYKRARFHESRGESAGKRIGAYLCVPCIRFPPLIFWEKACETLLKGLEAAKVLHNV